MSVINEAKNNVSVVNQFKGGGGSVGWNYDQADLTYDGLLDPISGMPVYYDGIGTTPTFTNESKNNVSVSNEAKNNV